MAMQARDMDLHHEPPAPPREPQLPSLAHLAEPLQCLPPVDFAFAYGSGVFAQQGKASTDVPMVDYILAVQSPMDWHFQNLEHNPNHYSSIIRRGGAKWVCWIADNVGVGVHFNPYVPWRNKMIKYGVISTENLVRDILTWEKLYISGRLHKPVSIIVDNLELGGVNKVNLQAALSAALLLLPSEFSEEDLLTTICSISYMGDIRMFFAEDKHKVRNIVRGSAKQLHNLYKKSMYNSSAAGLLSLPSTFRTDLQSKLLQDGGRDSRCSLISALPSSVLDKLALAVGLSNSDRELGLERAEAVLQQGGYELLLKRTLRQTVRASSFRQMVSGFFAAGSSNAVKYVARKASKAWLSRT